MNSDFGDWPGDGLPGDDFPGDDADTADLGGGGDGPLPQEGFGPADTVSGFGAADDVPFGDDGDDGDGDGRGGDSGGGAGALSYGGDLSGPDPDGGGDDADIVPAEAGFGAAPAAESGFGPADPPPGADPDAPAGVDEWPAAAFPPPLDPSGVPTPVDGWPWADPDLIGGGPVGDAAGPGDDTVDPADVAGYADGGGGTRQWATLIASDDPATSTLARFWSGG